ncbi:hypothetical protein ABT095_14730, partial [Kitasatospora sp. NPDC002227]|uniref:tetratricopeptide repeat protein n=1 Tax=Kitasatospora sp. NPDC002227 TaxID=3154773 RepID=UPI00332347B5
MLPDYVERGHDRQLRAQLEAAAADRQTVLVVVRGESCTGKTRTAFEAIQRCLADWQLVFPKDTDSLLALLAASVLAPRTILWLNEAQDFLTGPAGEAASAALRRRLEQPGPVVVLATLWPAYHRELTATPPRGEADVHARARALLGPVAPVDVPGVFTGQALRNVRSRTHPSLATAVRTSANGAITQTLAAGPQLVDRYEQAGTPPACYGRAVITAAMDARRLGHTSPLPAELLKAAAPGYLTDEQRAAADSDTWFAHALVYARTKVKDVVAALSEVPHPTGMGALPDFYRLADYLDHHARTTRQLVFPPHAFWTAVQHHAATLPELHALAGAAAQRGRYRIAERLYRQVPDADATDTYALAHLAVLREDAGDREGAELLARQAADGGYPDGLASLAEFREEAGDSEGAEQLYRQAADAGYPDALINLAQRREKAGDREGAEHLYQQAVDAGSTGALTSLADLREKAGDREGAELLARQAADAGHRYALISLAQGRQIEGDHESAEHLYQQAVDAGSTGALTSLADLREKAGDRE